MLLALTACTTSREAQPRAKASDSSSSTVQPGATAGALYGLSRDPVGEYADDDTWVGFGVDDVREPGDGTVYEQTMIGVGARRIDGRWAVVLRQALAGCQTARLGFDPSNDDDVSRAPALLAGGVALVGRCETGGSDKESVVAVVGARSGRVAVLLDVDCGSTTAQVEGDRLTLTRADLSAGSAAPTTGLRRYELVADLEELSPLRPDAADDNRRFVEDCASPFNPFDG